MLILLFYSLADEHAYVVIGVDVLASAAVLV